MKYIYLMIAILTAIVEAIIANYLPYLLQGSIHTIKSETDKYVLYYVLYFAFIWSISKMFLYIKSMAFFPLVNSSVQHFMYETTMKLHKISWIEYKNFAHAEIISALKRVSFGVHNVFHSLFVTLIPSVFQIWIAFFIVPFNKKAILVMMIMYCLLILLLSRWYLETRKNAWKSTDIATIAISDSILNATIARLYIDEEANRIKHATMNEAAMWQRNNIKFNCFQIIISIFLSITLWGMLLCSDYHTSVEKFVLYQGQLIVIFLPLRALANEIRAIISGLLDLQYVCNNIPNPETVTNIAPIINNTNNTTIELSNVSFQYKNNLIINDFSNTISIGERAVLIGHTGSGKSTLLYLIAKFIHPSTGTVSILGNDNASPKDIAKFLHFIPQDHQMFNGSLLYNISYGMHDIVIADVHKAIDLACLTDLVDNIGLDGYIGERGIKLSEGEKQRVAIARAILHKPQILLLDETFSGLDPNTANVIKKNLWDNIPIIIYSTHDLQNQKADKVWVLP